MEYATGVITGTLSDYCVVKLSIDDAFKSFSFHKSIFYMFGVKCDGCMTNILEGGMNVDLCYRISRTNRKPVILAVWYGENPPIVDKALTTVEWYDQHGRVSYCLDDNNILVQNDAQNHAVIISVHTVYRDGLQITDIGSTFAVDDEVHYDAVPLDFEHPFGVSFQATCAWLGRAKKTASKNWDTHNDIHGMVVTIPNDTLAVVDVQRESRMPTKMLLFRSSFEVACDSIREMVSVGDTVCMNVGHGHIFQGCKQWYARKALKVCELIDEAPVDEQEVPVVVSSVQFPAGQTLNGAKVPVAENSNDHVFARVAKLKDVSYVKEHEPYPCKKPSGFDRSAETGFVSLTKPCDCVKKSAQTGSDLLIDASKSANIAEKTVGNYIGVGVKSATRSNGRKEILRVVDIISTSSSVVKEGRGSLKQGEGVGKTEIAARKKQQASVLNVDTKTRGYTLRQSVFEETRRKYLANVGKGERVTGKSVAVNTKQPGKHVSVTEESIAVDTKQPAKRSNEAEESIAVDTKQPAKRSNEAEESIAVGTKQPAKHVDVAEESIAVGIEQTAKHVNVTDTALACSDNMLKRHESDIKVSEAALGNFVELNKELDMLNNNGSSSCKRKTYGTGTSIPLLLYNDPPLSGTISRFTLDCGCVKFKNFKIFVKPDNFYIDGVRCPVKHFVKYARAGSSFVNFEAILSSDSNESGADFTHEALCAWVGEKPSLVAFTKYTPPPKLSLLELHGQDFCGGVSNLYLPDSAVVVIHGDETTVIVQVDSFSHKAHQSKGNVITDFVKLNEAAAISSVCRRPVLVWDKACSFNLRDS